LAIPSHQPRDLSYPEVSDYTSNVLQLFAKDLERRREAQVLDVGPVCGENINLFAPKVKRLYVCDMFLRLDRERRSGLPFNMAWQHLDYPPQSFDGILFWDLADHLDDLDGHRLIELCYHMLKPGGLMPVFALGEQVTPPIVSSFVIREGFRVHQRLQPHLELPVNIRQNRKILALMTPFTPAKSFIYRNGLREFLFRRD
jgi:hypothetical protein